VVATVNGVAAAARRVATLPERSPVGLVVRGDDLDSERVAAIVGAPVLTTMARQRGLAEAVELGFGPVRSRRGPLAGACRRLLAVAGPGSVAA
jgi:hypothetical protein